MILYNIQKKNNNQSNKIYKDVLLNNLYQIFTEIYQKQAIYYFANLFIEPVIFYNQENDHYIPIFHFSFFEYIFLDKSNHDEIEQILNEMKSVGYYLIYNPYFIRFYKKYQYIYQFIYQKSFQSEVYVETEGGSIEEDLSEHLESNPYYEDYLSSDFKHDFLNFGRSKLTLSSYQKIEKYLNGNSETHFFKRVFADLIQMKRLKNKYFLW